MAPPRSSPRLADLDPETVARDVCRAVSEHLAGLVVRVAPGCAFRLPSDDDYALGLGSTVQHLTRYAQVGLCGDWTNHGCASDACLDVFAAIYSCAGSRDLGGGVTDTPDLDADEPIDVVLLGALGRILIDQRGELQPRHLAALSGLTSDAVTALIRAGEIPATETKPKRIAWRDARRWLRARGVEGL